MNSVFRRNNVSILNHLNRTTAQLNRPIGNTAGAPRKIDPPPAQWQSCRRASLGRVAIFTVIPAQAGIRRRNLLLL